MDRTLKVLVIAMGWLGFACFSPSVAAATDAPAIIVSETGFNFGEMSETTPVSRDFVIKNGGKTTLEIRDVKPS